MKWKVSRAFAQVGSGTTPRSDEPAYYEDGKINWLITGDINDSEITNFSKKITTKAIADYPTLKIYPKGSLAVAMYGATIGKVGLLTQPAAVNQACCVMVPDEKIFPKYAFYYFLASKQSLIDMAVGGGQPNISQDIVKSFGIKVPNIEDQKKIATYLDQKTAIIDKMLIAKKKIRQELLEAKSSIVANAVFGRNQQVDKKHSNIAWMGDVPKNWNIRKLKEIATIAIGWTPDTAVSQYFEGGNVWVTITDMNQKYISDSKSKITDTAIVASGIKKVPKGSLLYSFKLSVGKVAFADTDLYTNEAIASIIPKNNALIDNEFMYYALGEYLVNNANENIYGAKLLNQSLIKNAFVLLPPIEEQKKIAVDLNKKLSSIDKILCKNDESIKYLEEYKSSLISNVVSGKVEM